MILLQILTNTYALILKEKLNILSKIAVYFDRYRWKNSAAGPYAKTRQQPQYDHCAKITDNRTF
jgi:hypothetical protein